MQWVLGSLNFYRTGWSKLTGLPHPWVIYHRVWAAVYSNSACRNTAPHMYILCSNDFHCRFASVLTWTKVRRSLHVNHSLALNLRRKYIISNNRGGDMTTASRNMPYCRISRLYCSIVKMVKSYSYLFHLPHVIYNSTGNFPTSD